MSREQREFADLITNEMKAVSASIKEYREMGCHAVSAHFAEKKRILDALMARVLSGVLS